MALGEGDLTSEIYALKCLLEEDAEERAVAMEQPVTPSGAQPLAQVLERIDGLLRTLREARLEVLMQRPVITATDLRRAGTQMRTMGEMDMEAVLRLSNHQAEEVKHLAEQCLVNDSGPDDPRNVVASLLRDNAMLLRQVNDAALELLSQSREEEEYLATIGVGDECIRQVMQRNK